MGQGRPPEDGVARTERLDVRLTPDEASALDRARGSATRSQFARSVIRQATSGGPK